MAAPSEKKPVAISSGMNFLFGGLAGMGATMFVQPLDLVKNRMQMSGEGGKQKEFKNSGHALQVIFKREGLKGIYTGLSAGLLRQATYTTTRLGVYQTLFGYAKSKGYSTNLATKLACGSTAGAIGSFVGTPAEVALVRMTSDGRLPVEQRRGYTNVFNALIRIAKEEGVMALWRGYIPTASRAIVVNAVQLPVYSQVKEYLLSTSYFKDGIFCHFVASMISGLATTAASMPFDIAKTRIQNMRVIDGKPEYTGIANVWVKTIKSEGFFSLWKGFTPYYFRLGPHTVLTFIILEQMKIFYMTYILKGDASSIAGL